MEQLGVFLNSVATLFMHLSSEYSSKSSYILYENIKLISEHVPTHLKPKSDDQFGYYLAGLIDGDGWFSKYGAHIVFHSLDASLAYYIKGRIGYGTVTKEKSKNVYIFTITKDKGLQILLNFINGKLRTQFKCDAIYKYILNVYVKPLYLKEKFEINTSKDLNNHWLAGFLDSKGSFQIKCLVEVEPSLSRHMKIGLSMVIDHKTYLFLDIIRNKFGGYIVYRKSQYTYYYYSTSFGSARKIIDYLDKYHMLSSKHVNYLKWRKVYQLVQEKKHLSPEGQVRIARLKSSMISYSKETLDMWL